MRISHLVESLERGGLERVVLDLASCQLKDGHDVQIVCLFQEGVLGAEARAAGIPVLSCAKRDGLDLGALVRLRGALRDFQTDVLHTHNAVAHYYGVAASIGLSSSCRITTRHGMGARAASRRREVLFRLCMRMTDVCVAVCEPAATQFLRNGIAPAAKLHVARNGIHVDAARPSAGERDAARRQMDVPGTALVVGTVGRLNWAKDHECLVRAFSRLASGYLVIVGEGNRRVAIERLVAELKLADRVRLLGDRADARALLPGFDVFGMSSVTEGYSIALLEACASALPIVATDAGGNREIVEHGVNGLVVPTQDPDALAGALSTLLEDPALRRDYGDGGYGWVLANGSVRSMTDRYYELYGVAERSP